MPSVEVRADAGHATVDAVHEGGRVELWRLTYAAAVPKPHVHPLRTMSQRCITDSEPADHPWHRGLWFSIKYVNGENFWEEEARPFGVQRVEDAAWETSDGAASVRLDVRWRRDGHLEDVIREERRLGTRVQDEHGYLLDWTSSLRSREDVLLERTPYAVQAPRDPAQWPGGPPFPAWGGYGGLVLRAAPDLDVEGFLLPDEDHPSRPPTGATGAWCALLGRSDGRPVTVGFLAHPSNARHPTPWYGGSNGRLLNAAVLFHEPMVLRADEPLVLRYRIVVADRRLSRSHLAAMAEEFAPSREDPR